MQKVLKVGFVAMGNSILHASLTSPQLYELSVASGCGTGAQNSEFDRQYEKEDEELRRKYVEFYGRRQQEFNKIDTCHYQW